MIAAALAAISICMPGLLADDTNSFLRGFINEEILSLLGVIVSITLVSAGSIHIELGKLAKSRQLDFNQERRAVRNSAYLLIAILLSWSSQSSPTGTMARQSRTVWDYSC
jgi:hypothetical protein